MKRKICAMILAGVLAAGLAACGGAGASSSGTVSSSAESRHSDDSPADSKADSSKTDVSTDSSAPDPEKAAVRGSSLSAFTEVTSVEEKEEIEKALNLANMKNTEWTFDKNNYAWILAPVTAVRYPEIEDEQGVSVCVPAAYVQGIDTDGDGKADVRADNYQKAVVGKLVINPWGQVTPRAGLIYTADTAPTIFTTGAEGYGELKNPMATAKYASNGYISVACGNRGKQSTAQDADGNVYFSGNSPACLVDQKNAIRFVKYNMLLGNLPGSVNHFVTTGGSGGGAFAVMAAASSNNREFYDYEIESGAVGVYRRKDGGYSTSVSIEGVNHDLSDGVWGTIAYSPVASLAEADLAQAFEYWLDADFTFESDFQEALAGNLAEAYADYVNRQRFKVSEELLGKDLDGDGLLESVVPLSIDFDEVAYAKTRGYGGSYLDLYLAEFVENLQWTLDNLSYAQDWTWFDAKGARIPDWTARNMSLQDKARAFLEGRYARGTSEKAKNGDGQPGAAKEKNTGTSADYADFAEMLKAYEADISAVKAGDRYGKNIVNLYDPMNYIGIQSTENPTWARIVMGAEEGDMPLFASLNLQLKWLSAGTDAALEWQWDGGHVPDEILGESLPLYVDKMYGKHTGVKSAEGGNVPLEVTKPAPQPAGNGTAGAPTGRNISSWVNHENLSKVSFTLADAAAYRSAGAFKEVPGFDTIDVGRECSVFGDSGKDARHWNERLLEVFQDNELSLSGLFGK